MKDVSHLEKNLNFPVNRHWRCPWIHCWYKMFHKSGISSAWHKFLIQWKCSKQKNHWIIRPSGRFLWSSFIIHSNFKLTSLKSQSSKGVEAFVIKAVDVSRYTAYSYYLHSVGICCADIQLLVYERTPYWFVFSHLLQTILIKFDFTEIYLHFERLPVCLLIIRSCA